MTTNTDRPSQAVPVILTVAVLALVALAVGLFAWNNRAREAKEDQDRVRFLECVIQLPAERCEWLLK